MHHITGKVTSLISNRVKINTQQKLESNPTMFCSLQSFFFDTFFLFQIFAFFSLFGSQLHYSNYLCLS